MLAGWEGILDLGSCWQALFSEVTDSLCKLSKGQSWFCIHISHIKLFCCYHFSLVVQMLWTLKHQQTDCVYVTVCPQEASSVPGPDLCFAVGGSRLPTLPAECKFHINTNPCMTSTKITSDLWHGSPVQILFRWHLCEALLNYQAQLINFYKAI